MVQFKEGQTVRFKQSGGQGSGTSENVGIIRNILTEPGMLGNRNVDASKDEPHYEIENQNTGKRTTVHEKNLMGLAG
ncbi:hypothetical protein B7463_g2547, partial [Scytalidium lignicola]